MATPTPDRLEVEKWKSLGGVDLSSLEPEERHGVVSDLRLGVYQTGRVFHFRCPMCGNQETNDQLMEPACTGPNAGLDEHPMIPMDRI